MYTILENTPIAELKTFLASTPLKTTYSNPGFMQNPNCLGLAAKVGT